jgi:FtsX-like permease family
VIGPRDALPARRMAAHWVVLAAVALTTLVAAATGAALAAFAGQALPQAVRHDLVVAQGTSLDLSAPVTNGDVDSTSRVLKSAIGAALAGVPFAYWHASWSDPLGFVPGALPRRPASEPAGITPLLQAAAMQDARTYAVLVSGHWPSAPGARGPIPAALPQPAAALLGVTPGDVLRLRDSNTGAPVSFLVTGLFAERQPTGAAAPYWQLDSVPASGSITAGGFSTYGPLLLAPAAFGAALAASGATWVTQPDMAAFTGTDLSAIAADQTALRNSLNDSDTLSGVQLTTSLPAVLADIGDNLAVARALLVISGLQLLVLTVAATLAAARLLLTQRESETALLTARGATRWQLTRLAAAEVVPLCAVAALAGGVAGVWLARFLCEMLRTPAATGAAATVSVSVTAPRTWGDALVAALVAALLTAGAMLVPVLRSGPAAAQARHGRRAAIAGAIRVGADLALIVLAVLAGWQLRRYSAVSTTSGGVGARIDPVLALAPALALAGGTVVTLRLLPPAARAIDRLAGRGRKLTGSLAGWQFSRQPLRQGGAALLLVMAVATGTLALAQHESWTRSAADQAADTAGADVRVNLAAPLSPADTAALTRVPGVLAAMPVAVLTAALPSRIVAVDAATASQVVPLRGDQSPLRPAQLFAALRPPGSAAGADVLPAIATAAFAQASKSGAGSSVNGVIDGIPVRLQIVAQVSTFPTVTGSTLIVDLPALQAFVAAHGGLPLPVTQWWLATAGGRVPPGLVSALPPRSTVTSRTALAAATVSDPLSAAPQQALLAVAAAAALLAVTGFWVSIAANVRQRRAENALLAALGVAQRSAAAQLFLEKLLLSVPSAALGLLLGTIVARLLVPAVTLTTTAQLPVPPPVTLFDLPQTIPLAVAVAVLPALAAALVIFRRPDPAAELRAAEAA